VTHRPLLILAACAAPLLAACTGSDPDPTATVTASASPPPTSTAPSDATTAATQPSATGAATTEPTATQPTATEAPTFQPVLEAYPVVAGSRPHDVAPAADGGVWYTGQRNGTLGWLDPATSEVREIPLGPGSAPHGVIVDASGVAWVTDGGQNAIVRVDPDTSEVVVYPLPSDRPNANLNTAAFDGRGRLWFTGQNGIHGVFDPATEEMQVFDSPRGRGPYGIATAPNGDVYYASLAGSYLGAIDLETGAVTELDPPTSGAGVRRVWFDSAGAAWIAEWNAGQVGRYEPDSGEWTEWKLPGDSPQAYAVYVDEADRVWLTDFGGNAIVLFEPRNEEFTVFPLPATPSNVRQLLGRPGEVWGAQSAADALIVVRY
jgi:virginiamycin B lyase